MRIALSAAVLGSVLSPTFSLSYHDRINGANRVTSPSEIANEAVSYLEAVKDSGSKVFKKMPMNDFINGASSFFDEMNAASVLSYSPFESIPADAAFPEPVTREHIAPEPVAPEPVAPKYTVPEQDTRAFTTDATNGSGMSSYLESVPQNPSVGGPGMTSYLDSVPQNPAVGGAGMTSYINSVSSSNGAGASYQAAYTPSASVPVAGAGSGMSSYLDSVPQNPSVGGPGITSYLDSVPQNPAVGGAGMTSYLDSC